MAGLYVIARPAGQNQVDQRQHAVVGDPAGEQAAQHLKVFIAPLTKKYAIRACGACKGALPPTA